MPVTPVDLAGVICFSRLTGQALGQFFSRGKRAKRSKCHIRPEDRFGEGSLKQKCRDNFAMTKVVGSSGGFPISIEHCDERATILFHGKQNYRANVSESPAGTIASVEHALDSFEDPLRERETDIAQSVRQSRT